MKNHKTPYKWAIKVPKNDPRGVTRRNSNRRFKVTEKPKRLENRGRANWKEEEEEEQEQEVIE